MMKVTDIDVWRKANFFRRASSWNQSVSGPVFKRPWWDIRRWIWF